MDDIDEKAETCADTAESSQNEVSLEDTLILSKIDLLKKAVSSQQEWEAYLLKKLKKQEKAKGDSASSSGVGLFQRLKNVFKTPKDSHFFLETETEEFKSSEKKDVQEESPDLKKS